jgi:rubrerythrin
LHVTDSALRELADDPSSRKRFLKTLGGAGAIGAFSVLLAACGGSDSDEEKAAKPAGSGGDEGTGSSQAGSEGNAADLKIVNYALTLEFLEADLYRQVVDSGVVKDKATADLARKFGDTEQEHVEALKALAQKLGGEPVQAPKTRFDETIDKGLETVLETAATVENLGAAAYLAEAGRISSKEVLAAALAIHSVEARHAAALNILIGRGFGLEGGLKGALPDGAFARPMNQKAVLAAVKPFLA